MATLRAARLAQSYIADVLSLQEQWRATLRAQAAVPRADAAAWAIIDQLPVHPMVSAPVERETQPVAGSCGSPRPHQAAGIG
jgi:hypothetical protein